MQQVHRSGLPLLVLSCSILCACGGQVDDSQSSESTAQSSSSAAAISCTDEQEVAFTPLRRLTRFEYANSVRDLLGVDSEAFAQIPADEADGFDNNAELQVAAEFLIEKYVTVSETLAEAALSDVQALTGCDEQTLGAETCALQFARSFGRKAYRRPLSELDEQLFMSAYAAGEDYQDGLAIMIRMALQSPHFLYRLELSEGSGESPGKTRLNPFEIATRLAYFIWSSGPDDALLDAAQQGQLASNEQVAAMARSMLASPKAQISVSNFVEQWSGLRKLETMTKNTEFFPTYSNDMRAAMQAELPAFIQDMFSNDNLTLRTLFTSNTAYVSGPLAEIYGVTAPSSSTGPSAVELPAQQARAGLLTQAGFMAVQAHPDQTSPVLRGKFVRAQLLCTPPPPPPDDVDISVPELSAGTTARDRAEVHLAAGGGCAGCHALMDPIGLAFEHFDALGQFREYENGSLIDVSGEVEYAEDPALQGAFTGVQPLAEKLASSEQVHDCVATQMFRYGAGRREGDIDACSISPMQEAFLASGGDFIELMVAMTQTDAFLYRNQGAQ